MSEHQTIRPAEPAGWVKAGVIFAGTMMIIIGVFHAGQGLVAILNDEFLVIVNDYTFDMDITAWGWIHLILGVLVALAGFYLFTGSAIAGGVAVALACISAIANFFFIPYYPIWSIVIIAIDIAVVWAVVRSGIFQT